MILVPKEIKLLLVPWTDCISGLGQALWHSSAFGLPLDGRLPSRVGSLFRQHGFGDLGSSDRASAHQCLRNVGALLHHFRWFLVGHMVLVLTDNTTVAAYINRRAARARPV